MIVVNEELTLSVIAPMYNEVEGIAAFCDRLRGVLESMHTPYEVLIVDDGSEDGCADVVLKQAWPQCRLVSLARNVGHQRAIEAGMSVADGNYIVTMDADGQHPPELVPIMLAIAITDGVDVVYGVRTTRQEEGATRRGPALAYYRLVRWLTDVPIVDSQADFRLVSRSVLATIKDVRGEKVIRMLLPSLGYRSSVAEFEAGERIAGESRFGLRRQVTLALDSVFGFSAKPLRLVAGMGWLLSTAAFLWFIVVLLTWVLNGAISGWTSVMSAVLLVGGMSLLGLSIIGEYVARIHDMMKNHPRFVITGVRETFHEAAGDEAPQ